MEVATLRLGIITELFHPHVGGQEIRYFDFCEELVKQGHEVSIFTVRYAKGLPSKEKFGRMRIYRYAFSPFYVKDGSRDITGVLNYSLQSGIRISMIPRLDAVIFNQWPLLHVVFAEPLCNTTTIIDWCEPWNTGIISALQKTISRFPDGHIVVNKYIKTWLIKNCKIKPAKIEFIPSAVRTPLYKSTLESKEFGKIVFVGRLSKHKRLDILVEAVKIAKEKCPKITLDIIGQGPLYDDLKENVGASQSFIKLHGFLEDNAKIEYLKRAWAFAILSEREGLPRVVAEALAAGTPIVTSDSPQNGTRYTVRETNAGVICSPNASEVAERIIELYNDTQYWKKLSINASMSAAQFDLSNVTKRLIMFIKSLSGAAS